MRKIILLIGGMLSLCALTAQSAEKEKAAIRLLRAESNKAIADHDIDKLASYWLPDLVLVRGNSTQATGKDQIVADWKKLFLDNPKVSYLRTPDQITISLNDTLAWETGTWKAYNSYSNGGNYSAMWKKRGDTWKIQAELFVSLF